MADNSSIPVASGNETFANKDIAGVKFPKTILHDSTGAEVVPAKETGGNLATIAGAVSSSKMATKAASGDFADGAIATIGAKADAKSAATDATAITAMSVWKQISASIQAAAASLAGTLTVATHAVTQSGSWALSAGSALIGIVKIGDGSNVATIKPASTAPVATDPALVVAIHPDSVNANGRGTPANSAPVVLASQDYQDVAASQSSTTIKGQSGATGGAGDWLDFVEIFPESTSPGQVTLQDGANTAVAIFYGGATSVGSLVPFTVPVRAKSANGAWKIVTGAAVHVRAVGNFQ